MPCTFINTHSIELYNQLTDIFSFKLKYSETGITDLFIFGLADYCKRNSVSEIEIYHAKKESVYGADIDLFVEQSSGKYLWFALQAKVLNYSGIYKDLRIKKKTPQQWEKLESHEKKHGCKAFYLFYNGDYDPANSFPMAQNMDCSSIPSINEYGMGLVERNIIDNHFTLGKSSAKFLDFFPNGMYTLKKLVCCDFKQTAQTITEYDYKDIATNAPYLPILSNKPQRQENSDSSSIVNHSAPYRIIISKNKNLPDSNSYTLDRDILALRPIQFKKIN